MVTVCLQADAAVGSLVLRPPVMHPVARRDLNSTRLDLRGLRLGIAAALCTGTSAGGGIDPQIRFADGANFIDYAVGIQAGAFLHRPFQRTGHRAVVNARARLGMDLGTLAAVAVAIMGLQMLYAGGLLPVDATGLVMRPLLRQLIRRRNSQVTTDLTAAALRPDLLILCIAVAIVPLIAVAGLIDTGGVVHSTSRLRLAGMAGFALIGAHKGDVLTAYLRIARPGLQMRSAKHHVISRRHLNAATAKLAATVSHAAALFLP